MERILVIGNGFNMDLGLISVGYEKFFSSAEWINVRRENAKSKLIDYISKQVDKKEFSIENQLNKYAKECPCYNSFQEWECDRDAYYDIEYAFQKYVKNGVEEAEGKIRINSTALRVWREFEHAKSNSDDGFFYIYLFNYVLLDEIADIINGHDAHYAPPENTIFQNQVLCDYIHGRSDGNRNGGPIILGIAKAPKMCLSYMEKSNNQAFMPQNKKHLKNSLKKADYIEIFGVGMWDEDMPYFLDFFKSFKDSSFSKNKTIIIYDYNVKSITELKERIKNAVIDSETYESIIKSIQFVKTCPSISCEEEKNALTFNR